MERRTRRLMTEDVVLGSYIVIVVMAANQTARKSKSKSKSKSKGTPIRDVVDAG